ncbi:MAG TPA: class I SAM-dependent methyltransferase [Steroidobacteraceae bacterium]|nr:class I SAM-dependent methyltransferase [Steroidobacteraceae bacterium]
MRVRPFDELAWEYDASFTGSAIGKALRELVWSRLERAFPAPCRILELGCGTGEDALYLARQGCEVVALDSSARMIQVTRQKARTQGHSGHLELHCLSMEQLATVLEGERFDGVLSNFGAINCVGDVASLAEQVALRLKPGARLVWVVMGRHVPWEWLWYSVRGEWKKAWRRFTPGGVSWRGMRILYPTPVQLTAALRRHFKIECVAPLGFALPPSYAGPWLERRPLLLNALTRLESIAQRWSVLAHLADHYVMEATRLTGDPV